MSVTKIVLMAALAAMGSSSAFAAKFGDELSPSTFLEYSKTGKMTLTEDKLTTEKAGSIKLKLINEVVEKGDPDASAEHQTKNFYFEIQGKDEILLCSDATPANFIEAVFFGYDVGVVLKIYKNTENADGVEYIKYCGDQSYR